LLVLGAVGFALNQRAFQAGPLTASLPALTVVEPIVSAVIGITMLHEEVPAHGAGQWLLVGLSVAAMAAATIALSRATAELEATPAPAPT
jgi:threonine/homoserine efflux transporter RhtA